MEEALVLASQAMHLAHYLLGGLAGWKFLLGTGDYIGFVREPTQRRRLFAL